MGQSGCTADQDHQGRSDDDTWTRLCVHQGGKFTWRLDDATFSVVEPVLEHVGPQSDEHHQANEQPGYGEDQ